MAEPSAIEAATEKFVEAIRAHAHGFPTADARTYEELSTDLREAQRDYAIVVTQVQAGFDPFEDQPEESFEDH